MTDDTATNPLVASLAGTLLGSYRLVSELGAGGMGAVWLAEHTLLGSRAAIKVLRPELSQNAQIVQRFFDEARAATRINHPGIVTVLDFGQQACAFLVMEHLTGETMMRAIQRERMAPARALSLVRQCALAMTAAHAANIVHRDLKPDNIFIVPDPLEGERIKILDFGIAKLLGDDTTHHHTTQTGLIMGTPAYMSPEQCRGAGRVDHRTDIYALGCVLFHALTGRPPFVAETPGDLIACHLTMPAPIPSAVVRELVPEIDAIVARCLAKSVDERFATMAELVTALTTALGVPLRASQPIAQLATPVPVSNTAPTKATGAVGSMPTTMRGGTEDSVEATAKPWRGGAIVGGLVLIGVVITIVALMNSGERATTAPSDAAVVMPIDATRAAAIDAGVDAKIPATIDAGVRPPKNPPRPPRPPRGSNAGSGYDIYDSR